ncbi:MAG: hypothetical protein WA584_23335 [Pyrinomonadaceae bacterium]
MMPNYIKEAIQKVTDIRLVKRKLAYDRHTLDFAIRMGQVEAARHYAKCVVWWALRLQKLEKGQPLESAVAVDSIHPLHK